MAKEITQHDLVEALQPEHAFKQAQAKRPHYTRLCVVAATQALKEKARERE